MYLRTSPIRRSSGLAGGVPAGCTAAGAGVERAGCGGLCAGVAGTGGSAASTTPQTNKARANSQPRFIAPSCPESDLPGRVKFRHLRKAKKGGGPYNTPPMKIVILGAGQVG